MTRIPIHSLFQYPSAIPGGPNAYGVIHHLGLMYSELQFLLSDFCRMHQIVYKEIGQIEDELAKFGQVNEDSIILNPAGLEQYNEFQKFKIIDNLIGKDLENRSIISFIDQMAVVGLWAITEQFLGKIYRTYIALTTNIDADTVSSPYRWDKYIEEYANIGIDLSMCDGFQDANECRVVNNAIKHDPTVGRRLEAFPYFTPFRGFRLVEVPLDMQRYLNGVNDLLGSLMEKVESQLDSSNA